MGFRNSHCILLALTILLSNCGPGQFASTPTPMPTIVSVVTSTWIPTSTPTIAPTITASPTNTATPTPAPAVNQTTHGYIREDEIWRGEIRIVGDIIVEEGATLTIEPGTIIRVDASGDVENLNTKWAPHQRSGINMTGASVDGVEVGEPFWDEPNRISIRIWGTLNAVGKPDLPIIITSDSSNPRPYDWNILEIHHGVLSYAVIEYHRIVQAFDGVVISHNVVRNSGEQGVGTGDNASPVIEYNQISYAGHELIYINGGAPIIRYNILGPNPFGNNGAQIPGGGIGIAIAKGTPQIIGNIINGCYEGILYRSSPDGVVLEGNIFIHNRYDSRQR